MIFWLIGGNNRLPKPIQGEYHDSICNRATRPHRKEIRW